jgi:multimeric flavodoxin WrbA
VEETVKIVGVNGSPRKEGNTRQALETMFEVFRKRGAETELVQLADKRVEGCIACYKCGEKKNFECVSQRGDDANEIIRMMHQADAIILGSPVYFGGMTAKMKALIERAGIVAKSNDNMLKGKIGSAIVIARRAGASFTFASMNFFFFSSQMVLPGSTHWNQCYGRAPGEIANDSEGQVVLRTLAENMADLLDKCRGATI